MTSSLVAGDVVIVTLDDAWKVAEDALPQGWTLVWVGRKFSKPESRTWTATAQEPPRAWSGETFDPFLHGEGESPAGALMDLARVLWDVDR